MKSNLDYIFSLGSDIFSWASKKQENVLQSSAAVAAAAGQAIWLRIVLTDMGEEQLIDTNYQTFEQEISIESKVLNLFV